MKKIIILFLLINQVGFGQINTYSGRRINTLEFETIIKKAMDSLQVQGMSLAVINNGKIVFNKGFGVSNLSSKRKVTPSTFFEAASLSKPVFAYFVLKLAGEKKIDLDKPLFEYEASDAIIDDRYKKITASMVLSHTTGLPNWREGEKMQLQFDPGKQFSYSGEGFLYLAKVIAKIYHTSLKGLDAIFQKEVAQPLKLENFHFVTTKIVENNLADGYQKKQLVKDERDRTVFDPAGGLYANTKNYSRFLIWLMSQTNHVREMFEPAISLEPDNPIQAYFGVDTWTLGLAIIKINSGINYWHGGNNLGYTSSFMINPAKKFGYVYFTNEDQCNSMKKILEKILWQ